MGEIRADVKKNFFGIDSDHSLDLIAPNSLLDAENIRLHDSSTGGRLNLQNVQGNRQVDAACIASDGITCKTVGCYEHRTTGMLYFFNYHLGGSNHGIYELNIATEVVTPVLQGAFLAFTGNPITSIDIIDSKLLIFTEQGNPPRLLDLHLAKSGYYTTPQSIMLIKAQPQYLCIPTYISNPAVASNNLKKQLFQFRYRYQYESNLKSAWSGISAIPIPINEASNLVSSINLNNNGIKFSFYTGNQYVLKIDFAVSVDGLNWNTFRTIDKSIDLIGNGIVFGTGIFGVSSFDDKFAFYNNNIGIPVAIIESSSLFDDVPFTAGASSIANGNTLLLGNVTKGRPNLNNDTDINGNKISMNIQLTVSNSAQSLSAIQPFSMYLSNTESTTQDFNSLRYYISFLGVPHLGDIATFTATDGSNTSVISYAIKSGDQISDVMKGVRAAFNSQAVYMYNDPKFNTSTTMKVEVLSTFSFGISPRIIQGSFTSTFYPSQPAYKDSNRYIFVLQYYDEFGRPGPAQEDSSSKSSGIFNSTVYTPSLASTNGSLSQINWNILHNPPAWAAYYAWGRTQRLRDTTFTQWFTNKIEPSDTNKNEVKVFIDGIRLSGIGSGIRNLDGTVSNNTGTSPSSIINYQFSVGDRISFIKQYDPLSISAPSYTPFYDTEITSFVQNPSKTYLQHGSVPGTATTVNASGSDGTFFQTNIAAIIGSVEGKFITFGGNTKKIVRRMVITQDSGGTQLKSPLFGLLLDSGAEPIMVDSFQILEYGDVITCNSPSFSYTGIALVEVYTPRKVATDVLQTYYEFGERYDIVGGQHSISSGVFTRGDVFQKAREMVLFPGWFYPQDNYIQQYSKLPLVSEIVTDPNYNDNYQSARSDNGRPMAEDPNSATVNYYTQINFSQSYFSNTTINGLATFYFSSFKEYDRNYQSIQRIQVAGQKAIVFQELRTGHIPINQQITLAGDGKTSLQLSQSLLNNINYYEYEGGIGKNPESLSIGLEGMYFSDFSNTNICRLASDGIVAISDYGANTLFIKTFDKYKSTGITPRIYTTADRNRDSVIVAISPAPDNSYLTIEFHDGHEVDTKKWTSRFSFQPDFLGSAFTEVFSFKYGIVYKHNSLVDGSGNPVYNNFYGVTYPSRIKVAFNNQPEVVKSFMHVSEQTNSLWTWDLVTTNLGQKSFIPSWSFNLEDGFNSVEGIYYSDVLCDTNKGSLVDGDDLKGNYLIATLTNTNKNKTELFSVTLNSIYSPLSGA